jgi:hypothetical protein|nr:hypothetical protein [Brucella anthropi]
MPSKGEGLIGGQNEIRNYRHDHFTGWGIDRFSYGQLEARYALPHRFELQDRQVIPTGALSQAPTSFFRPEHPRLAAYERGKAKAGHSTIYSQRFPTPYSLWHHTSAQTAFRPLLRARCRSCKQSFSPRHFRNSKLRIALCRAGPASHASVQVNEIGMCSIFAKDQFSID